MSGAAINPEYARRVAEILRSSERFLREEIEGALDGTVCFAASEAETTADNLRGAAAFLDTVAKLTPEPAEK